MRSQPARPTIQSNTTLSILFRHILRYTFAQTVLCFTTLTRAFIYSAFTPNRTTTTTGRKKKCQPNAHESRIARRAHSRHLLVVQIQAQINKMKFIFRVFRFDFHVLFVFALLLVYYCAPNTRSKHLHALDEKIAFHQ